MAFESITQDPTVMMALTFIGVLIIGFAKFYERKTAPGGTEVWDDKKFAMFFVVAAAVMLFEYVYTGTINFPGEEMINMFMLIASPIFGVFGTTYTAIVAGKLLKNNVVIPVVSDISTASSNTAKPVTQAPVAATPVKPPYKKMTDSTRRWLTFDATPENKATILAQIDAAEKEELYMYQIHFTGGYYNIVGGILNGGAGNPSGDV